MYIENNDIRSLRDRAPEGCGCERGGREGCGCTRGEPREGHPERSACPMGSRSVGAQRPDCSNYFMSLGAPLAAVYAPIQVWKEVYGETQALARGTLFAELDKPFMGKGRKCK